MLTKSDKRRFVHYSIASKIVSGMQPLLYTLDVDLSPCPNKIKSNVCQSREYITCDTHLNLYIDALLLTLCELSTANVQVPTVCIPPFKENGKARQCVM